MDELATSHTDQLLHLVMQGAQLSRAFPSGEDREYYLTLYPELRTLVEEVERNCIDLTHSMLQFAPSETVPVPVLDAKDGEDILERYEDVIFSTDEKLEYCVGFFCGLEWCLYLVLMSGGLYRIISSIKFAN